MIAIAYTCREVVGLVTEYLEGGLTPAQRLAFERHVTLCPPCRGHLSQLRTLIASAPALRENDLPPSLRRRLADDFAAWKAGES